MSTHHVKISRKRVKLTPIRLCKTRNKPTFMRIKKPLFPQSGSEDERDAAFVIPPTFFVAQLERHNPNCAN